MKAQNEVLFLSLRPQFAEMIISGSKTVELRRIRPRALPGTLVLIYASSPTMKLIGTCVVKEIVTGTPREIWKLHGGATGLKLRGIADYLQGTERGVAISVGSPIRFDQPLPLEKIRSIIGESAPPQSFRYISSQESAKLLRAGKTAISML